MTPEFVRDGAASAALVLAAALTLMLIVIWIGCVVDLLWMLTLRARLTSAWLLATAALAAFTLGTLGRPALTIAGAMILVPMICRWAVDWHSWRRDAASDRGPWRGHVFRRADRLNRAAFVAPAILGDDTAPPPTSPPTGGE